MPLSMSCGHGELAKHDMCPNPLTALQLPLVTADRTLAALHSTVATTSGHVIPRSIKPSIRSLEVHVLLSSQHCRENAALPEYGSPKRSRKAEGWLERSMRKSPALQRPTMSPLEFETVQLGLNTIRAPLRS